MADVYDVLLLLLSVNMGVSCVINLTDMSDRVIFAHGQKRFRVGS